MHPISPETAPDRFTQVLLPLTVGVSSALLVFSVLVFAFGDAGTTVAAPPPAAPVPSSGPGTSRAPAPAPGPPRVVRGSVRAGDVRPEPVHLDLGEELRVKLVPESAFDAQMGITMPKAGFVADYVQKGFKGDVQRLFPIQNGLLYGDTLTPSDTVALEANDLGKEGAAEWLVFVAPTAADYTIVVRGRASSAGSYTLTVQTRAAPSDVAGAKRLDADARWLDHGAVTRLAADDLPFLLDRAFYADPEFRTDGDDTRPTGETAQDLIANGS